MSRKVKVIMTYAIDAEVEIPDGIDDHADYVANESDNLADPFWRALDAAGVEARFVSTEAVDVETGEEVVELWG